MFNFEWLMVNPVGNLILPSNSKKMLKRINIIYIVAIGVGFLLWQMSGQSQRKSPLFYGFAETKETEMNLEFPVEVKKLYVTTGQRVKAGDLLAEVMQTDLGKRQTAANIEIEEVRAERALAIAEIDARISKLKARREAELGKINSEIEELRAETAANRSLLKDINSEGEEGGLAEVRLKSLQTEKGLIIGPLDAEIRSLKRQLNKVKEPFEKRISSLEKESDFYEEKSERLKITAPTDGLIGNIHVKEAEFISSFNTLITFYEENPTAVQGFVHESMILQVEIGDTLTVVSSLHHDVQCQGVVTGLGSRIIEIPARLRKFPEIKNYGREVLIQIPRKNTFLQKEKVVLKISPDKITGGDSIFKMFSAAKESPSNSRLVQNTKQ